MATLEFTQDSSSSYSPVNSGGRTVNYATSGRPRITITYPDQRYEFDLVFRLVDNDTKNQIEQFYRSNENLEFDFTYIHDGFNYSGYFIDLPIITPRQGPDIFTVTLRVTARRIIA